MKTCSTRLIRRGVAEHRDAERLDVVGQERAAAGQRVAARRRADAGGDHRQRAARNWRRLVMRHFDDDRHQSTPCTITTFVIVLPAMCACTFASASATLLELGVADRRRHPHHAAQLAVHLHRNLQLLGLGDLGVERRPASRRPAPRRGRTSATALPSCAAQTATASRSATRSPRAPPCRPAPSARPFSVNA